MPVPGGDAAIVRLDGTMRALALSTDGKGRFGSLDPYLGAMHAVAESARNVAVTGARPLAITNCLNFGNPERPVVMWQFAESIRGIRDACLAFDTPVTGGNVSFYNESAGSAIWPTPVIGMLGLLDDHRLQGAARDSRAPVSRSSCWGRRSRSSGARSSPTSCSASWRGHPPALDLAKERALHALLVEAAASDVLASAHDCADGGLAVALVESAIEGGHGFAVTIATDLPPHVSLFSESASRAVVSVAPEHEPALARARRLLRSATGATGRDRRAPRGVRRHVRDHGRRAARALRGRDPAAHGTGGLR